MFPIFSGILMILIGLPFVGSIFFGGFSEHSPLIIVLLFIMYLVFYFIGIYFVIPVYIYENLPVSKAIKRSAHVFKDTWGETFIGYFGLGLILFPLALIGLIPIAVGFDVDGLLVGFIIALLYWIIIACLGIAAQGVLKASLYRYATTGKISADIVPERLLKPRT
jgi:hypothetical protein